MDPFVHQEANAIVVDHGCTIHCLSLSFTLWMQCQWSRVGNSAGCGANSVDVGWQRRMWFLYLGDFIWVFQTFQFQCVWVVRLFHFLFGTSYLCLTCNSIFVYNIRDVRSTGGLNSCWHLDLQFLVCLAINFLSLSLIIYMHAS